MPAAKKLPGDVTIHPDIVLPHEYELGPAMQRLTERQRAFVMAMLDFGGIDNTKAYRAAGYRDNPESPNQARVNAHYLAHDPKVQDAIREEAAKRLKAASVMAVNTLLMIADDVATEKKDRLKALEMILNRSGLPEIKEQRIAVTHTDETTDGMIKRAELLAKKMGMDPQKLMGTVMNGKYKDVTPTPEAENIVTDIMENPEDDLSDIL